MAYTERDFRTKKELKQALLRGEEVRADVRDGPICLEGPHYPRPHTWYAEAEVKDGVVINVK